MPHFGELLETLPIVGRHWMETSLHRQLKEHYAVGQAQLEMRLDGFRIDVVADDELVEIQHGPLAAIRDKVGHLLAHHQVLVVKPIVVRKRIVRQASSDGPVVGRRWSPKQGILLELFHELVYFTRVFPHPNLRIDVPLVDIEEWRYPGHGRRRRRRPRDHVVKDQLLLEIREIHRFHRASDLLALLPDELPQPFHTGQLADRLQIPRWFAQRIAYCLRCMRAAQPVGKQGNALLYQAPIPTSKAA